MASRKCPHCRARSNYEWIGDEYSLAKSRRRTEIQFQRCIDSDCQGITAVITSRPSDEPIEREYFPALQDQLDEGLNEDVAVAFGEALKALDEGIWNGCVIMCSRALDEATKHLQAKGDSLFDRIEDLAETHRITPELAQWAHTGRLAANLARHGARRPDDEKKWNDETDAREIVEFSRWFFRYVYVLPSQLAERRKRLQAEEAARRTEEANQETPAPEGQ